MDRLIYTVLSGMRARAAAQAVTANNLANAGTSGFRRELSSLASRYVAGPEATARVQAGNAVQTALLDPGTAEATGQPLDVAIDGRAGSRSRRPTAARPIPDAATCGSRPPGCFRPATAIR